MIWSAQGMVRKAEPEPASASGEAAGTGKTRCGAFGLLDLKLAGER